MSDYLEIVLLPLMASNILIIFLALFNAYKGFNLSFVNPFVIYKNIKVNWFGAWSIAILLNILLPLAAIPYWVYKICIVGRK